FVISHARSWSVRERYLAVQVRFDDAWDPKQRLRAKNFRVEVVITDASIDHIDTLEPARGAHLNVAISHDEILGLHQLDAHLLGQEAVLVVRAVVTPGRQHYDPRLSGHVLPEVTQHREQAHGVVVDGPNR